MKKEIKNIIEARMSEIELFIKLSRQSRVSLYPCLSTLHHTYLAIVDRFIVARTKFETSASKDKSKD